MGGVVVFPGGKLDDADGEPRRLALGAGVHPRARLFADDPRHALALAVCACRETLEEAALLPCAPNIDARHADRLRARLEAGTPFDELLEAEGLSLRTADLVPFARWITPAAESRRYDARFFLTELPSGQQGRHDDRETVSSVWASPIGLIDSFMAGDLMLAPPTLRILEVLRAVSSVAAAVSLAREQSLLPICPRFVPGDPPALALPGDPEHESADRRVSGATRFVLRDGKFLSEDG
jgi:8-oxo-dGTP pyrophosphatase MutT (NUDIX family)